MRSTLLLAGSLIVAACGLGADDEQDGTGGKTDEGDGLAGGETVVEADTESWATGIGYWVWRQSGASRYEISAYSEYGEPLGSAVLTDESGIDVVATVDVQTAGAIARHQVALFTEHGEVAATTTAGSFSFTTRAWWPPSSARVIFESPAAGSLVVYDAAASVFTDDQALSAFLSTSTATIGEPERFALDLLSRVILDEALRSSFAPIDAGAATAGSPRAFGVLAGPQGGASNVCDASVALFRRAEVRPPPDLVECHICKTLYTRVALLGRDSSELLVSMTSDACALCVDATGIPPAYFAKNIPCFFIYLFQRLKN